MKNGDTAPAVRGAVSPFPVPVVVSRSYSPLLRGSGAIRPIWRQQEKSIEEAAEPKEAEQITPHGKEFQLEFAA